MNVPLSNKARYLEMIRKLNVYRQGDRRAPHKPLLLLLAIAELLRGHTEISFGEAESNLIPLLKAYAPPVKARHQPELPYWYLRSDGLWMVPGADELPRQSGGFPKMSALRSSHGQLEHGFARALSTDRSFLMATIEALLDGHFPESIHEDILESVGLALPQQETAANSAPLDAPQRTRNPSFRKDVLRAYEHRCAVTGFRAALAGQYFGCEAAHVQWHAYDGPDSVANGFAVEPTLHKLFDAGAWTLTDDRRILVSAELTGTDATVERLRDLHGRQLRKPLSGEREIGVDHIQWHREAGLGGVFRHPALPL